MEYLLSDIELEEIANYALNPSNWGHRHNKEETIKEDKKEEVYNLLNTMAGFFRRTRENYFELVGKNYWN